MCEPACVCVCVCLFVQWPLLPCWGVCRLGVEPALIAAIISRQSEAGSRLSPSGYGEMDPTCFGLMQVCVCVWGGGCTCRCIYGVCRWL